MQTVEKGKELVAVEEGAEQNKSEVRLIESIDVGKAIRQGDIYIHRVPSEHAHGKIRQSRQLAIGTTKGSRHILEGAAQIFEGSKAPDWAKQALLGPFVEALERCIVTHPEHAHISIPAGTYQITHQLDARTMQRVRD